MQSFTIQSSVLYLHLLLLHFLSAQLPSSAYNLPDKYFINCGSSSNDNTTSRAFTGDMNPGSFTFTKKNSTVENVNKSAATSILYQTARIFRQESSYKFEITIKGTYLVRLHFFAFSSPANLSSALFDVSASGYSLLQNFSVGNGGNTPMIKEFFLSISADQFILDFVPQESFFAFVNAIEVFPVPESFFYDEASHISPIGRIGNFDGLLSMALMTVHRINVGGSTLTPDDDTLWRYWVPDDRYIYNPVAAKNYSSYDIDISYQAGISKYTAPATVYQSAKGMKIDSGRISNLFNITWSFEVRKNTRHFIRVHFCDIVGSWLGEIIFNLYIYVNFDLQIDPYKITQRLATPFFDDFVVDSDNSGLLNITIGPSDRDHQNAFLNGLEIMEILAESGSTPLTNDQKKKHLFVTIGIVLGSLALIFILAVVLVLIRCRKSKTAATLVWPPVLGCGRTREGIANRSVSTNLNLGLKISLAEIRIATKKFDAKLKIGKGGFGTVYRGSLFNGMNVAVKRSEPGSSQGFPEFQTEIMVLSRIRHRHLVSLVGYCDEKSEMILVYELMEKGTLRDHLYNSDLPPLSWKKRLEICIGAARGLHYLHRGARGGFIHRDVKSTNILLDENYVAKVADFGLSRLGAPDQTHVTTGVKGTFGYLDPEYFRTQQLTEKSDVYSFGVVLLEVLCARPAINALLPRDQVNLADWVMLCKEKDMLEEIIDPKVKGQINPNSLRKFSETAEKCLLQNAFDRPTMGDVLWDLEYALQLQQTAIRRYPQECSRNDASATLSLPNVQTFPSLILPMETDDMPILREHNSDSSAAVIFSQLQIDEAR
ncbi:hypothetical protein K2173_005973 [Erythroxylum novogranatense]|uniref:Protein kinase domain-containing protein n=1 Tax=Erythroxylum novogranatense TaxID=1862640 RepID=A0AAV8TC63_9ROSI|nr:hypothetical protein K2173_005973 [Erythroxylum novogranatense]